MDRFRNISADNPSVFALLTQSKSSSLYTREPLGAPAPEVFRQAEKASDLEIRCFFIVQLSVYSGRCRKPLPSRNWPPSRRNRFSFL